MDTPIVPQKRCSKKELCCHPKAKDGGLPATNEYFHKDKGAKDGLSYSYKGCAKVRAKQWAQEHPEQVKETQRRLYLEDIDHRKASMKEYRETHKDEINARTRAWYWDNIDHTRKYSRELARKLRRANPAKYRAIIRVQQHQRRHALSKFTLADVKLQIKAQTDKKGRLHCWWGGEVIEGDYHLDHVIALDRGGTNDPSNIVISCAKHNLSKGAKTPGEFMGRLL